MRAAVEAIEDPMLALGEDPRTRIGDLERRPVSLVRDANAYPAAGGCVLDGVVHEVDQRLTQHQTVANAPGRADAIDRHRLLFLFGEHGQVRGHVLGELAQVDRLR